jgi:hypothetical protein
MKNQAFVKSLFVLPFITLLIACGENGKKEDGEEKPVYEETMKNIKELSFPFMVFVDEYNPGKPCSEEKLDSGFVKKYLNPEMEQVYTYYACGKTKISEDVMLLAYCEAVLGAATPMYHHGFVTFNNKGEKIDTWMAPDSVCCNSELNVTNEPVCAFIIELKPEKVISVMLTLQHSDKDSDLIAAETIAIDKTGHFKSQGVRAEHASDIVVNNTDAGELMPGMTLEFLTNLVGDVAVNKKTEMAEGDEYTIFEVIFDDEKSPAAICRPDAAGIHVGQIELVSTRYVMMRNIRVGGTLADIKKELTIEHMFGTEDAQIAVSTKQFPNVNILLDGSGYQAYPGTEVKKVKDTQKIVGFYMYKSE